MQPVNIRYGDGEVKLDLSAARSVEVLNERPAEEIKDLHEAFRHAVEEDSIGLTLRDAVRAGDQVTLVVSDITRWWMRQDKIVPLLVDYLHDVIGVPYGDMAIVIALGTHRPHNDAEMEKVLTRGVLSRVRAFNHDCRAADLVHVGDTSRGTKVRLNPLAVGRKLILVGGTTHHLMAGYGGGRKSVVPGIAGEDTIRMNHIHALDPNAPCSSSEIGLGLLPGNPIHEDMMEAAELAHPAYSINLVMGAGGGHAGLYAGQWREAWLKSCRAVEALCGVPIAARADAVVASAGGFPKDVSLYQATKGLLNASMAVKPGGLIAFAAECREGGGAESFFGWIKSLRRGALDPDLRKAFTISGYIFYAACEVIAHSRVIMLTKIDPSTLRDMGIEGYADPAEWAAAIDLSGMDAIFMPNAGAVVPVPPR